MVSSQGLLIFWSLGSGFQVLWKLWVWADYSLLGSDMYIILWFSAAACGDKTVCCYSWSFQWSKRLFGIICWVAICCRGFRIASTIFMLGERFPWSETTFTATRTVFAEVRCSKLHLRTEPWVFLVLEGPSAVLEPCFWRKFCFEHVL